MKNLFSSVILIILSLIFFQEQASAVPIFARKYNTSCMTCHVGFPKLNAFGEAFKTNGYRLPNDEVFVKEPPVWLGSEAYKRVWPNAVWPSSIPSNVPISFQIQGAASYQRSRITTGNSSKGQGRTDFEFPEEIVINSIGTLGDNFSFLLAYSLQSADARAGVELASIGYNDFLAGKWGIPKGLFNMKIGFLQPQAMPFGVFQTLTGDTPAIYDFRISSVNQPAFSDAQTGMELFGVIDKRTRYVLGVVNGVARNHNSDAFNDNNSDKDFYGRIEHKFGGLPFDGSADSQNQDQLGSGMAHFDQGPSVTLGATGYSGTDQIDTTTDAHSRYYRVTGFARANSGRYNVDAVYLHEEDNGNVEQYYGIGNKSIGTNGFYVEGTAAIYPWLFFVTRYERLVTDHISLLSSLDPVSPTMNTSQLTLSLPIYLRANIRIIPEIISSQDDPGKPDTYRVRVHLAY